MSRSDHLHCLICNEPVEADAVGIFWARLFDGSSKQVPPLLVVHESCAHDAAHPSFDWSALERKRADRQALVDQLRGQRSDTRSKFLNALGDLSEQEARIVRLRYALAGSWPMTLEEVGRVEGMTREQVGEIEARAFEKLQALGHDLEP